MILYDADRFSPAAPVAGVVVRHPETGRSLDNVPMLIDSGADLTLLPISIVKALDLERSRDMYSLVGFDGTRSEVESVRADLVFLGRRFRGRFLLLDSDLGIIGRDLLNHVRLLLDGPGTCWREWPDAAPGRSG